MLTLSESVYVTLQRSNNYSLEAVSTLINGNPADLNGGENVYSIVQTLGGESLFVLAFTTGHLDGSKVMAWKMIVVKEGLSKSRSQLQNIWSSG